MKRFKVTLYKGKIKGIRNYLDMRVFCNNYIGTAFSFMGYGFKAQFKIHEAKLPT